MGSISTDQDGVLEKNMTKQRDYLNLSANYQ